MGHYHQWYVLFTMWLANIFFYLALVRQGVFTTDINCIPRESTLLSDVQMSMALFQGLQTLPIFYIILATPINLAQNNHPLEKPHSWTSRLNNQWLIWASKGNNKYTLSVKMEVMLQEVVV